MVKHFEKHGGDGLSWLASWLRQKEMNEHERRSVEMRCLITCLHLSGTYDQLNSPCLASMETIARRIAQIVEAYSGDGGRPRWSGVHHYEGQAILAQAILLKLKKPTEIFVLLLCCDRNLLNLLKQALCCAVEDQSETDHD